MAIKPIQGFYVHDEETNTDGIAKVSIDAVQDLVDDLNGAVESWLDEHPDVTTTVQDGAVTEDKLLDGGTSFVNSQIANLSRDGASWLSAKTVFRDDSERNLDYHNGLGFDGEYFYTGYTPYPNNSDTPFFKLAMDGSEIDNMTVAAGHGGTIGYNVKDGYVYIGNALDTVYVYTRELEQVRSIDVSENVPPNYWRGISYDPVSDKSYLIATEYTYIYNSDFSEYLGKISTPETLHRSKQGACICANYLFMCSNYPNVVTVYKLNNGAFEFVKNINVGKNVDNTMVGEIQGVAAYLRNGKLEVYFSSAAIVARIYYNSIFSLNADPQNADPLPFGDGNDDVISWYVDADYTGISDGSDVAPWKSFSEALAHTNPTKRNRIDIVNADATIDKPPTVCYAPPRDYDIRFTGASEPVYFGEKIRFFGQFVQIVISTPGSVEFSFQNCKANIEASSKADASTKLVVSNRSSHITVTGDLYWSYNVSGTTIVTGACGKTTSSGATAITTATNLKPVFTIEEGQFTPTSGDGTGSLYYKKYSDGTCECWGRLTMSTTSATATGALYYSEVKTVELPFKASLPLVYNVHSDNYFFATNFAINDGKNIKFRLVGARSSAQSNFFIFIHVRGMTA